jgi:hypothetical protein
MLSKTITEQSMHAQPAATATHKAQRGCPSCMQSFGAAQKAVLTTTKNKKRLL